MKISQIKQVLPSLFTVGLTPLLIGHKGIGKTELVRQYAKENNYKLVEIRLGQASDAGDVLGLADFETKGKQRITKFLMPEKFADCEGERTLLFFDEINRASKELMQFIFELIHERRVSLNGFSLSKDSRVICAQNPSTDDYDVLAFEDEAYKDRFCQIKVDSNTQDWIDYATISKVDQRIVDYIRYKPNALNADLQSFEIKASPSARKFKEYVAPLVSLITDKFLLTETLGGIIGMAHAAEVVEWINKKQELNAEDILANFKASEEELKKLSSGKSGEDRQDVVGALCSQMVELLSNRSKSKQDLTEEETKNFVSFLKVIPLEKVHSLLQGKWIRVTEFLPTLENNKAYEDMVFKATDAGTKKSKKND